MSSSESSRPFTKTVSWDEYMQYRPPYPDSMWKLWFDYHKGPLDVISDIGTGGGVAAHDMASRTKVKRMYLSDPGKEHLDFAERFLKEHHSDVEFVLSNKVAEDRWLEDGSVDFLACCEALHWVDVDKGMPVMADSLRPGGTFAAVYYLPFPRITNSRRAQEGQTRLLDDFGNSTPDSAVQHPAWRRGFSNSNMGMDFVPFDEEVWTDVRRIEINLPEEGWPSSASIAKRFGVAPCRVGEGCVKERWEDGGWKTRDSAEGLRKLLQKFLGAPDETWDCDAWREVLAGAEEVGGVFELSFQVAMVLARKR
ncbi:hypothetical protein N3K66_007016 [Trichothecium roseum]|uniref:Uncharacterized protein n=1 Tax=Trichothecium roseum TaxID=47278 RepID=A0ACC0UWZ8_9HYPO|nr:hypothetical protein N3K66_007016 [Trichothecium roseum]